MSSNDIKRQFTPENDDILTLSEAAAYLKLGERTIQRMIGRSEIPCARVGGQWRFLRSVLDDWLMSRMQVLPRNELAPFLDATSGIVRVSPLVDRETVVDRIEPGTPGDVLRQLVAPLERRGVVSDVDQHVRLLLAREQLSSTALGHGVAVPHVRRPSENPEGAPAVLLGLCREGTDFGAFDGRPVHLFLLLGATSEAIHLRLLKRITLIFRDPDVLDTLLACDSAGELVDTFARTEDRLFPGG